MGLQYDMVNLDAITAIIMKHINFHTSIIDSGIHLVFFKITDVATVVILVSRVHLKVIIQ